VFLRRRSLEHVDSRRSGGAVTLLVAREGTRLVEVDGPSVEVVDADLASNVVLTILGLTIVTTTAVITVATIVVTTVDLTQTRVLLAPPLIARPILIVPPCPASAIRQTPPPRQKTV
jgi:hypothetical protein